MWGDSSTIVVFLDASITISIAMIESMAIAIITEIETLTFFENIYLNYNIFYVIIRLYLKLIKSNNKRSGADDLTTCFLCRCSVHSLLARGAHLQRPS